MFLISDIPCGISRKGKLLTGEALEKAWRDRAGVTPLTPLMAFEPDGLTLGAGTVLAPLEDLSSADAPGAQSEARLCALLSAAYRRPIAPQAIRYIRRGAVSWRDGDKAMAAMHLAMTGLTPLRDVKGAARRLFMADALMKAGTEPETILRALDLSVSAGADRLTRYSDQQYRNPKGSGVISGRWAHEGAVAGTPDPGAAPTPSGPSSAGAASGKLPATQTALLDTAPPWLKPLGGDQRQPPKGRPAQGRASPPPAPVRAPAFEVRGAAATAESEGAPVLTNLEAFAALASRAARLSAPAVFFSVLLIPSNRMSPDKIAIPGYPNMHLERGFDETLWYFVYKDREGNQRRAGVQDGGFIATVEGHIVGRIDDRDNVVLVTAALDTVTGVMTAERGPDLCPAQEPDRPGQGATGEARDYENRVKRVVNPYRPTPNALAYYLKNPDARDGRVSFDDCQHETGIMIEAKGPGFTRMWNKAQARLTKNPKDLMGNNVVDDLMRQGELQVDAAKISGNRPIIWYCQDQELIDDIKRRFKEYGQGLENINFFHLP
jgi:hypothetical protein